MGIDGALIQGLPGIYLVAAASSTLAGFIGALSGMGGGPIVAVAAAQIFGVKATVPLMAVYMLLNNLSRLYFFRSSFEAYAVRIVLVTAIPMSFVGARIYGSLDASAVSLVLGAVLLLSIPLRRFSEKYRLKLGGRGLALAGVVIGVLGSTTVGTGVLLILTLLGAGVFGPALLAARSGIGLGLGISKVAAFGVFGMLSWKIAVGGLLMGVCAIPGAAIGAWVVKHTNIRLHTFMMDVIVLFLACSFLYEGIMQL